VRALTGNQSDRTTVANSYDKLVHLSIGSGWPAIRYMGSTTMGVARSHAAFAITSAQIASLGHASLSLDYQGGIYVGGCTSSIRRAIVGRAELDNISVTTAVPGPPRCSCSARG